MTGKEDAEILRAECLVRGRVQGVWFRKHAQRAALELALAGWARNLDDGRVQVVVEGPEGAVTRFLRWLWIGPSLARVDHVDVATDRGPQGEPVFEIRPNATVSEAISP